MRAEYLIGNNVYVIEQSESGKTFKVFCNNESFFLSESIHDCTEIVRDRGLKHLQEIALKAKDDWYRLAYGYPELFLKGAPPRTYHKDNQPPILLPDLSREDSNCNCLVVDPHNCDVHGLEAMRIPDEK